MIYCVLPPSLYCSIHKLNHIEEEEKYVIFSLFIFQAASAVVQTDQWTKRASSPTWYAGDVGDDVVRDWREHLLPPSLL